MLGIKNTTEKNTNSHFEEMLKAGVHFGYSRSRRHPKIKDYIFGVKNNVEIFNLEKTKQKINEAKDFLKNLAKNNKKILLVGTKVESRNLIEKMAKEINMPFVNERWVGGTLTNFKTIKGRIGYMNELLKNKESGELNKYTKKEQVQIEKKIAKLKSYFGGLDKIEELPSAIIVVDTKKEKIAVAEAKRMFIPVAGILNSDCDPDMVNYPIPANDNSVSSVGYILQELKEAYKEGLEEAEKAEKTEKVEQITNNK